MKNKVILFVIAIILSLILAQPIGKTYSQSYVIPGSFSSFLIPSSWDYNSYGFILAYIFLITVIYTAFSNSKYLMIILLIPAFIFEITFDFAHLYVPVILGTVGWGIGVLILKLMRKKDSYK